MTVCSCPVRFGLGSSCRGIVSAASTAVSKTVRPGSNPGTPASESPSYNKAVSCGPNKH